MIPEKTKRIFLEIEDNEKRIVNLLNETNGSYESITSENSTNKNKIKTFPLKPPENLLSRIVDFLPQIASDNKELVKKDIKSIDIENVEGTERVIEMNLGLGIFEQIKKSSERNIMINPKESTFDSSIKPKIIMVDNETENERKELVDNQTKNGRKESSNEILYKDDFDFDDENSESFNILMNIQSLNHKKKPKIIVLDDNQSNDVKRENELI